MTGIPVSSANSTKRSLASALMMPPPATISGRCDAFSIDERLFRLLARGPGLVDGKRLIGLVVELDLGHLHVDRQVDQHGTRPSRAHEVKGLLKRHRDQRGFANRHRPFRHRLGDVLDVDRLEILLIELGARRLASDTEDRNRIRLRGIEPGDHVRAGGAGRADADADIARFGAAEAIRHVRGALDMPGENVTDRSSLLQRGIERIDRGARHAERRADALEFEHPNRRFNRSHSGHGSLPPLVQRIAN